MDDNSKFEEFELSGISIDIINDSNKLEEEKSTLIKTSHNITCDDNNKDNKEEAIKDKSEFPFLEDKKDAQTQTEPSYLDDDDDESSNEKNYKDFSYINKKRKSEGNNDECI